MPKVDEVIMSKKDKIVSDLKEIIKSKAILSFLDIIALSTFGICKELIINPT